MTRTLTTDLLAELAARLEAAHKSQERRYPGACFDRRPIHVVYGGAHLFRSGTARRLGDIALGSLDHFAPDFVSFAKAVGLPGSERLSAASDSAALAKSIESDAAAAARANPAAWLAHTVYQRVREKLTREPIEDYRIDFEDGYGNRPDTEEDGHAVAAAKELASGLRAGSLPPFFGIRIKPLSEALGERSLRTLDLFLTELAAQARAQLPKQFRITLPKVTLPDEVSALADVCSRLEPLLDFEPGALRIEIMVESPRAIFNERGEVALLPLAAAARGRCIGAHFGPYDYTASLDIAAPTNALTHFASDFARELMQVALAGTGIALADGPTNILPIPPHKSLSGGDAARITSRGNAGSAKVSGAQQASAPGEGASVKDRREENVAVVHRAWRLHFHNIRHALAAGFYQGWDLHPAQLPVRYAATYSFLLENLDSTSRRLRNFIEAAAQATRLGHVFDDAAMAQGLLNYFRQAINCGAVSAAEIESRTTLSLADLRSGSFAQILASRRA
jgi:citrate lyase beta subunit